MAATLESNRQIESAGECMDDQRFDQLARVFASGVPRRRVLGMIAGGFAAAVARVRDASAGCNTVCVIDNDCCPGNLCLNGVCTLTCAAEGQACIGAAGNVVPPCCQGLDCVNGLCVVPCSQGACEVDGDCCQGLTCQVGQCAPPPTCNEAGGGCKGDLDCCQGLICDAGTCAPPPTCNETGGGCQSDTDCCKGLICDAGTCAPPPTCAAEGESCIGAAGPGLACCKGLVCVNGICTVPCSEGACKVDGDCCTGLTCQAGQCAPPDKCSAAGATVPPTPIVAPAFVAATSAPTSSAASTTPIRTTAATPASPASRVSARASQTFARQTAIRLRHLLL